MIDILAALSGSEPTPGSQRCGVAKFLDAIPEDTPGRDELIRLVETKHDPARTDTRSGQNIAQVLTGLGYTTTQNPILDHRNKACRCYR